MCKHVVCCVQYTRNCVCAFESVQTEMQRACGAERVCMCVCELMILGRKMSMSFFCGSFNCCAYAQNANNENIIYFTHSG